MTTPSVPAVVNSPLDAARSGLDLCVHCGFCLQACPTYLVLEDENDSPRGRIVLMQNLLAGEISPLDPALNDHISKCLGCRGCETACPSGVPYGHLLEATRATLAETTPQPTVVRVMLALFARPSLLAAVMPVARLIRSTGIAARMAFLPGRIGNAMALLAASAPGPFSRRGGRPWSPQEGKASNRAADSQLPTAILFEGCVMRELYSHVHRSTEATLERNNIDVCATRRPSCCGALHAHAGDLEGAKRLAKENIANHESITTDYIAVNSAGCGAMMRDYPSLFEEDPEWRARSIALAGRLRDVSELLAAAGPITPPQLPITVSYDAPCHLVHAQRITAEPINLLRAIPGLMLIQAPGAEGCCGAAGLYNLLEPETAAAVLSPKLAELDATAAEVVATGNPGCLMHIGAGLLRAGGKTGVAHPVELLDFAYHAGGDPA